MPARYEIDHERRIVLTWASGVLSDVEIADLYARLATDPDFDASYSQFADLSEVERIEATTVTIADAARRSVFAPDARRAVYAPTDVAYGMARMWAAYAEAQGEQIEVFRDRSGAEDWVDW